MKRKVVILLIAVFFAQSVFAAGISNMGASQTVNTEFFTRFNDSYLNCYIEQALENNHDLKAAGFKVEQYRQQVKISFGKEFPSLSTGAYYLGTHIPTSLTTDAFLLPFSVSYEPDFLLKNHDKTKSYKKAYEAAQEEQKSIYISLLSDIATSYINIMQYDDLIIKQSKVVDISYKEYQREQKKLNRGVVDTTSINVAKQNWETDRNSLATLQTQEETLLNQFAILIGISPCNINDIKRSKLADFEYGAKIPTEILSDVICARPDVMSIENQLEQANINVRVARKELLPSFSLTGLWGFSNITNAGNFFSWQNTMAVLLAGTSIDIFKGGQKVANLKLKKAMYEEMFEKYHQTDLNALKEVNNALCVIKYDKAVDTNTQSKLVYQKNLYIGTEKKYHRGLVSYSDMLEADRDIINMEQNKIKSKTKRLVNYVTLYKAVGGAL